MHCVPRNFHWIIYGNLSCSYHQVMKGHECTSKVNVWRLFPSIREIEWNPTYQMSYCLSECGDEITKK